MRSLTSGVQLHMSMKVYFMQCCKKRHKGDLYTFIQAKENEYGNVPSAKKHRIS
jgi:hypothetical protein